VTNNNFKTPSFISRIYSIWNRHLAVYTKNLFSNGFPPFVEPLIFLAGIGLGLGVFIKEMDGVPYIQFLASGLLITTSMFTSAFECSYGTFIRLEFDKVYDGMIAAPLTVNNLLSGEILWAGTKGFFFSLAVLCIIFAFGIIRTPALFLVPLAGFLTGLMFSSLSLLITSFVKSIDQYNFYFSGFLSPMFFFSGVVFPISNLPYPMKIIAEFIPLTHPVRIARAVCFNRWNSVVLWDFLYIILFILIIARLAITRLKKRIID
jgi:lipooligosaccharide transport system permease protein